MRLYDVEQSAQSNIADSGQEDPPEIVKKFTSKKSFAELKYD